MITFKTEFPQKTLGEGPKVRVLMMKENKILDIVEANDYTVEELIEILKERN